ncbi:MAG TPA: NAD(P)H-flavin reductase [Halomonas campaniensis]|uniref:NAD(P)H-flavin reductase n=1 Tax=Halomonas campaniensis TaxID=213554 RepID=A0A3D0KKN6_9GAMM|nr:MULTISPECIES: NAD(P)H-flavin reductase [unclassified Halomonas]HBS84507.1 NAD(P)H-flavin reductase [Halomonas campaniensis]HCA04117.1 NAD(P)H-flavin reductase [Halomonas campaniensis]
MSASTSTCKTLTCQVTAVEDLNPDVFGVTLEGRPEAMQHAPGQYLELKLDDNTWVPFSIASAERGDGIIELHIQHWPERDNSARLRELLQVANQLTVRLPSGDCVLDAESERPLLLVAAGTGFAQMKAIVEATLRQQPARPISLWWANREHRDLYAEDLACEWAQQYANVAFQAVTEFPLTEPLAVGERISHHQGRIDLVLESALESELARAQLTLSDCDIFLSGSPGMVYACVDVFERKNISSERMFSDVFAYAPRPH